MLLIAAFFGAMCSLLLAIVAVIAAIRSRRKNRKMAYSVIAAMSLSLVVFLVISSLPLLPSPLSPPFVFAAAAPVPPSLTMYFAANGLGSGTTTHDDLYALRVKDGSTRFRRTYPAASLDAQITVDILNDGMLYTRVFVNVNSTSSVVLTVLHPNDDSEIWQKTFPNPMYFPLINDGVIYG